jgi:spore germination protein (amino acid permease)
MMKQVNRNVLAILLFECLLGTGTAEWIPSWTEELHSAVWALFTLYVLLMFGVGLLMIRLMQSMPKEFAGCTMFDYFFGQKVGAVLNVFLIGTLLTYTGKSLLLGVSLIHYAALPYTPTVALVLLSLFVSVQLLSAGFEAMLRFQIVLFWPAVILATILLLISFRTSDFSNLLPAVPTTWKPVVHSAPRVMQLLPGLILVAVYLPVFKKLGLESSRFHRSFVFASIGIVLVHALNLLAALAVLGPFEAASLQWPVLEMIRIQKLTGPFLERLDLIFLLPVLIAVVSAVNLYAYGAYYVLSHYTNPHQRQALTFIFITVLLLAILPRNDERFNDVYGVVVVGFELMLFSLMPFMWFSRYTRLRERRIAK